MGRKERIMNKLEPCPFCNDAWVYASTGDYGSGYENNGYRIACGCGYAWHLVKWHKTKENAIKKWNMKIRSEERKEE